MIHPDDIYLGAEVRIGGRRGIVEMREADDRRVQLTMEDGTHRWVELEDPNLVLVPRKTEVDSLDQHAEILILASIDGSVASHGGAYALEMELPSDVVLTLCEQFARMGQPVTHARLNRWREAYRRGRKDAVERLEKSLNIRARLP